jgi:hypothetical protein
MDVSSWVPTFTKIFWIIVFFGLHALDPNHMGANQYNFQSACPIEKIKF